MKESNACLNHEIKNKVNWKIREKQFVKLINKVKRQIKIIMIA